MISRSTILCNSFFSIKLITNNPKKVVGLEGYGLEITDRVPLEIEPNRDNEDYLKVKKNKMGHILHNLNTNEIKDNSKGDK